MPLSDLAVRQAKASGKAYTLGDMDGLSLGVSETGGKSWFFRYYWGAKQKRMSLGTYPEVSLRQARVLRDEARALLANGINPRTHRKQQRFAAQRSDEHSFGKVFKQWHAHRGLSLKTGRQTALSQAERIFNKDVLPSLGRRAIHDIKRHDLLEVLARIERRNACSVAKKVRSWFNQMFRYALVTVPGLEHNPASDLDVVARPQPPVRNNPFLRMPELPALLQTLRQYPGKLQTQLGVRLLLLTGVRTGELRWATPDQFHLDQGLWVIPPEVVKQLQLEMRKRMTDVPPYIVPLSVQAQEIVRHQLDHFKPAQVYVFPGERSLKQRISENTLNGALKRMGYQHQLTGHGIRATISTALNEIGYPKNWIDAQLSHADPNKVSATYNHAEFVEQRRQMMQDWADRLDLFEQGQVEAASAPLVLPGTGVRSSQPGQALMPAGDSARLPAVYLPPVELQPERSEVQREQAKRVEIFNSPHSLPVAVFAQAVGKSRRWINYEVSNGKMLALNMGNLGQRIPDWHFDPLKHRLIQAVLKHAKEADPWQVYHALSNSHEMLDGRAPVDAVTHANFHEAVMAACFAVKDAVSPMLP